MECVGVVYLTAVLVLGDASSVLNTDVVVVEALKPDIRRARTIDPKPGDFAFLRVVRGRTQGDVLRRLGHPGKVERASEGVEHWTYYRTDNKLFWVFFRNGRATAGIPTDGFHIGGAELQW
jgi:hypothetical protein